jgi:hypothetical protein
MRRIVLSLALVGGALALAPAAAQAQFYPGPLYAQRALHPLRAAERQVILWFQAYLGRLPNGRELAILTNQYLLSGNSLYTQSVILSSNEFYFRAGGTPQAYLNALFVTVLGRRPTVLEITALQGQLIYNGRLWFSQAFLWQVAGGWQLSNWNRAVASYPVPVVVPVVIR